MSRPSRLDEQKKAARVNIEKPSCFVSYSTREPHVTIFIDSLRIVFNKHFDLKLTPSALESGASQREQITTLIEGCTFAIVILDGLRPNVIFEYGIIHGMKKPVLLFKETEAIVDIRSFFGETKELGVTLPPVNIDSQFSDVKDVNYAAWNRFNLTETVRLVWSEYCKKRLATPELVEIEEPKLWP